MDKEKAFDILKKVGAQHGKADYILNEVYAHLKAKFTEDKETEFRLWFLRQWAKYQKGGL